MPAPKRSAIEAQIAELQAQLDTADTDDDVWIMGDDGRQYKVTGRRATSILKKLGVLDVSDGDDDDAAEEDDGEEEPEADPEPRSGYFGRGKK